MKKLLPVFLFLAFVSGSEVFAISPTYSNPTVGTMDFYPMMQHQMEKEETLDFVNDAENYKKNRAKVDAQNEYRANNHNFNPNYGSAKNLLPVKNNSKNMTFSTDANGNIIIKDLSD